MSTFDTWLRQLAAAGQLAANIPPATRGLAWSEPINIAGDYSTAALEGSIRLTPDAASPIVTFTITGPTYSAGVTRFVASLAAGSGANSTGALPADDDGQGFVELPCSFRLTPAGGAASLLFGGTFTVLGLV